MDSGCTTANSLRLPQQRDLVEAFDRVLREHVSEVRDYTAAFHERWQAIGTMRGDGWAVRPFLLPAARLEFAVSALHDALRALGDLIGAAASRGDLSRLFPFRDGFEQCVDVDAGLASPAFLAHERPDGFLFEDRFVLSEINYGNGIIVSCAYTDIVADYWDAHPVLRRLGWDVARLNQRPLRGFIETARRFARPVARPNIALCAHSDEWQSLEQLPERVMALVRHARDEFERAGLTTRFANEEEIALDRHGALRFAEDGAAVDLVMFVTVGTTFLDAPALMWADGPLAHFGRARIGDVWVLKPLVGLLVDKGALPLFGRLGADRRMADGFRFEVARTEYPEAATADRYLRARDEWVIKRAFDGKDTHVGIGSEPADWQAVVDAAAASRTYVAQQYVSMPRTEVPVFVDEQHLEWIESRAEVSPFMYAGALGGTGVRHAPSAEALVMTDFPPGYGFTTAFAV
jgi:hypothetical protein